MDSNFMLNMADKSFSFADFTEAHTTPTSKQVAHSPSRNRVAASPVASTSTNYVNVRSSGYGQPPKTKTSFLPMRRHDFNLSRSREHQSSRRSSSSTGLNQLALINTFRAKPDCTITFGNSESLNSSSSIQLDIIRHIMMRESCLREMKSIVFTDRSLTSRAVQVLNCLRSTSLSLVESVIKWREDLNDPEKIFYWNGVNYLNKVAVDCDFLDNFSPLKKILGFNLKRNPLLVSVPLTSPDILICACKNSLSLLELFAKQIRFFQGEDISDSIQWATYSTSRIANVMMMLVKEEINQEARNLHNYPPLSKNIGPSKNIQEYGERSWHSKYQKLPDYTDSTELIPLDSTTSQKRRQSPKQKKSPTKDIRQQVESFWQDQPTLSFKKIGSLCDEADTIVSNILINQSESIGTMEEKSHAKSIPPLEVRTLKEDAFFSSLKKVAALCDEANTMVSNMSITASDTRIRGTSAVGSQHDAREPSHASDHEPTSDAKEKYSNVSLAPLRSPSTPRTPEMMANEYTNSALSKLGHLASPRRSEWPTISIGEEDANNLSPYSSPCSKIDWVTNLTVMRESVSTWQYEVTVRPFRLQKQFFTLWKRIHSTTRHVKNLNLKIMLGSKKKAWFGWKSYCAKKRYTQRLRVLETQFLKKYVKCRHHQYTSIAWSRWKIFHDTCRSRTRIFMYLQRSHHRAMKGIAFDVWWKTLMRKTALRCFLSYRVRRLYQLYLTAWVRCVSQLRKQQDILITRHHDCILRSYLTKWHEYVILDLKGARPIQRVWQSYISRKNNLRKGKQPEPKTIHDLQERNTSTTLIKRNADWPSGLSSSCLSPQTKEVAQRDDSHPWSRKGVVDPIPSESIRFTWQDDFRAWIMNGSEIDEVDANGKTALHFLATREHKDSLDMISTLINMGASIDKQDIKGYTPLIVASINGNLRTIKCLVELGASLDKKDLNGYSGLFHAVNEDQVEACDLLLGLGSNPDTISNHNHTPLHESAERGYFECTASLLQAHADVDARNHEMRTPLHLAVMTSNVRIISMLLSYKASVDSLDCFNRTALHYAVRATNAEAILPLLCSSGAHANQTDENGDTPMHIAAVEGNHSAIQTLLKEGGDPLLQNIEGKTPSQITALHGHTQCFSLLTASTANNRHNQLIK